MCLVGRPAFQVPPVPTLCQECPGEKEHCPLLPVYGRAPKGYSKDGRLPPKTFCVEPLEPVMGLGFLCDPECLWGRMFPAARAGALCPLLPGSVRCGTQRPVENTGPGGPKGEGASMNVPRQCGCLKAGVQGTVGFPEAEGWRCCG